MPPYVISVPERLDELSVDVMRARLANAGEAEAIVFQGAPGRFCLGMDFEKVTAAGTGNAASVKRGLASFASLIEQILTAPRPTLAVIDGAALGGGLGIAAGCDFVLASDRSRFGLPEALYGLAPAIIRPALLTRLTIQKLNMLLFTCHSRSADEAFAVGLIDQIVPHEQLETATGEIVRSLRRARSQSVRAVRQWNVPGFAEALRAGAAETADALSDERVIGALRAAESDEELPWTR